MSFIKMLLCLCMLCLCSISFAQPTPTANPEIITMIQNGEPIIVELPMGENGTFLNDEPYYKGDLWNDISNNRRYPADALANKTEGTVSLKCLFEKKGVIQKCDIVKSVSPSIDNEAIRLMKLTTSWIPSYYNKEGTEWITINIPFELKEATK